MYKLGCILVGLGAALTVALLVTLESLRHTFPVRFVQKIGLGDQVPAEKFLEAFREGIGQFYGITKVIYIPLVIVICGGLLLAIAGRAKQRDVLGRHMSKTIDAPTNSRETHE